jgi:hypothetical protein
MRVVVNGAAVFGFGLTCSRKVPCAETCRRQ